MMSKIKLSLLILWMGSSSIWAGWHDRKAEGWAWYEDTKQAKPDEVQPTVPPTSKDKMEEVRKNLEEKLATALLEPSPVNVKTYMEEQQKWMERSSHFAHVWAQLLLNHPQLDYTATHMPISQYGLQVYKSELQEKKEKLITSLASDFGLFFFYAGESDVSNIFARLVQELSRKYGFEIVAISIDGKAIEGFKSTKPNNGIAKTLGVDVVPALYLVNPSDNLAIPISFGLVALDQIENNILLQFEGRRNHE